MTTPAHDHFRHFCGDLDDLERDLVTTCVPAIYGFTGVAVLLGWHRLFRARSMLLFSVTRSDPNSVIDSLAGPDNVLRCSRVAFEVLKNHTDRNVSRARSIVMFF